MFDWMGVRGAVWARRALRVLGVIALGALGSGLWEYLLKPALKSVSFWILDVGSLGLESFKGEVYMQVATSSPTIASIENLNLLTFLYSASLALWLISFFFRLRKVRDENQFLRRQLEEDLAENEGHVEETLEELNAEHVKALESQKERVDRLGKSIRRAVPQYYVTACLVAVMAIVHTVNYSRIRYINSAIAHYQQTLRIAYPYLSDDDRRRVESEFAQVRTKEDYVRVVGKLESISKDNKSWVPSFVPW